MGETPIRIVISYRRQDTPGGAGRLRDGLAAQFGAENVFYDIDTIPPGVPWRKAIEKTIAECDVLLPLIGLHWLTVTDEQGRRRLDLPNDVLRFEIEMALKREVRIIPIQLHGARMPDADELPREIADLTEYQSVRIDDDDWPDDLRKLVRALEQIQRERGEAERSAEKARREAEEEERRRVEERKEEAARVLRAEQQRAEDRRMQLAEEQRLLAEADVKRRPEEEERRRAQDEEERRVRAGSREEALQAFQRRREEAEKAPRTVPVLAPPPTPERARPDTDSERATRWGDARWPELVAAGGALLALIAAFLPLAYPVVPLRMVNLGRDKGDFLTWHSAAFVLPAVAVLLIVGRSRRRPTAFLSGALLGVTAMFFLLVLGYVIFFRADLRSGAYLALIGCGLSLLGAIGLTQRVERQEDGLTGQGRSIALALLGGVFLLVPVFALLGEKAVLEPRAFVRWGIAVALWLPGAVVAAIGASIVLARRHPRQREALGVLAGVGVFALAQSVAWLLEYVEARSWEVAPGIPFFEYPGRWIQTHPGISVLSSVLGATLIAAAGVIDFWRTSRDRG